MIRARTLAPPAICAVLAAGCGGNSYLSKRYAIPEPAVSRDIGGIPFTLNKPEFTVIRTPGSNGEPDSYQLKVAYVPDPTRRYVVRLDPATFANTDWTVTLDDGGSLNDTNGKITDQSAILLSSIAKLGLSVAALSKTEKSQVEQIGEVDTKLRENFTAANPKIFSDATGKLENATRAEVASMTKSWNAMEPELRKLAEEGRIAAFAYSEPIDRLVLETGMRLFPTTTPQEITTGIANTDLQIRSVAYQARNSLDAFEKARLEAQKADLLKQRRNLYERQRTLADEDIDKQIKTNKEKLNIVSAAIKELQASPREVLLQVVDLSHGDWQRRRLKGLNAEIENRRFADRVVASMRGANPAQDIEAKDAELQRLLEQKAAVLGRLSEYRELKELQAIPPTDPVKFNKAATAILALQKLVQDAEAGLNPAAPDVKPDEPSVAALAVIRSSDAPDSNWILNQLDAQSIKIRPRYVVVLHPTIDAKPNASNQSQESGQSQSSGAPASPNLPAAVPLPSKENPAPPAKP